MTSDKPSVHGAVSNSSRRSFLAALGGASTTALAGCIGGSSGSGENKIVLGNLSAQSGNASLTGIEKNRATQMAVDEINEDGGILGREVELLTPDPQSDIQKFQELSKKLINEDEVDALWAGIRSSVREAIRPTVDENKQLYFYTNQYEGGVCDKYTFPVGATSKQKLSQLVPHMIEEFGPNVYTVAADYIFGEVCATWTKRFTEENGGQIVGEEFLPISSSDFGPTINRIQGADPDWMMGILVGKNLNSFYDVRAASDLTVPVATTTTMTQAYEHIRYDPPALENVYAGTNFMEEVDTDRANSFIERYHEKYPEAEYMNENAQNNYWSVHMYKKAVEAAETTNQEDVIEELEKGVSIEAPEGDIELHGPTHHMSHHIRVAKSNGNHEISIPREAKVEPSYLQSVGCDLSKTTETKQYVPES